MGADFKGDGLVEIHPAITQEAYSLLIGYARETGLTIDQAVQQIVTIALDVDTSVLGRLAEADRLREEAQAKAEERKELLTQAELALTEAKALVASYEDRITWFTTCEGCAKALNASYAETVRAEEAEALLEKYRLRMAGGDERTHQIGMELLAATEGPYWYDEDEDCFRFHGVAFYIPATDHLGRQVVNKQIFKAPKRGTNYAEYWPDDADKVFLVNSWSNVAFLLTELQHAKNKVSFLLKMPRRIQSAIGLACPWADVQHPDDCVCATAGQVALKVGQEMRDELRKMDDLHTVDEPTPEPS